MNPACCSRNKPAADTFDVAIFGESGRPSDSPLLLAEDGSPRRVNNQLLKPKTELNGNRKNRGVDNYPLYVTLAES
jgi:hypothetical protein